MPEVEIDIDDLLEVTTDDERASKLQISLHGCVGVVICVCVCVSPDVEADSLILLCFYLFIKANHHSNLYEIICFHF